MNERLILCYRLKGLPPATHLEAIKAAVASVEDSSGRWMLVVGNFETLTSLLGSLDGWRLVREQQWELPDNHPKVK